MKAKFVTFEKKQFDNNWIAEEINPQTKKLMVIGKFVFKVNKNKFTNVDFEKIFNLLNYSISDNDIVVIKSNNSDNNSIGYKISNFIYLPIVKKRGVGIYNIFIHKKNSNIGYYLKFNVLKNRSVWILSDKTDFINQY